MLENAHQSYCVLDEIKGFANTYGNKSFLYPLRFPFFATHNISIDNYYGGLDEKKNVCNNKAL
jgi:hypothetical protein